MNKFTAFFAMLALSCALAVPVDPEQNRRRLPALQHEEIRDNYGQYAFRYVTAEGTIVSERGYLIPNAEGTGHVLAVEGETSYLSPDGKPIVTKYKSGPNGFEVHGNHLPVAPQPEPAPAQ